MMQRVARTALLIVVLTSVTWVVGCSSGSDDEIVARVGRTNNTPKAVAAGR